MRHIGEDTIFREYSDLRTYCMKDCSEFLKFVVWEEYLGPVVGQDLYAGFEVSNCFFKVPAKTFENDEEYAAC